MENIKNQSNKLEGKSLNGVETELVQFRVTRATNQDFLSLKSSDNRNQCRMCLKSYGKIKITETIEAKIRDLNIMVSFKNYLLDH